GAPAVRYTLPDRGLAPPISCQLIPAHWVSCGYGYCKGACHFFWVMGAPEKKNSDSFLIFFSEPKRYKM
ncbi:hypothetical protein, partial [Desulfobotulus alkaliphilus]|uniref:hypothetical protein n=1 Tax=Desulfobotulus alkaliphilus TaxID=622671 RepID=UPI001C98AB4D